MKKARPRKAKRSVKSWLVRYNKRVAVGGGAIVVVLLVYAGAAAVAVNGYAARMGSATMDFNGRLQFEGDGFLSPLNSDMTAGGTYTKAGPSVAGTMYGSWAGRQYTGAATVTGGRLYFDLAGPVMPVIRYKQSSLLYPLKSGQLYSAAAGESLYDAVCAHPQAASLAGKVELVKKLRTLNLMPSPWVNFLDRRGGEWTTHVVGSLSGAQLAGLWDALSAATPPGCADLNTIGLSASDMRDVATQVDLYAGSTRDQLVVTMNDKTLGAKATLTLTTSNYGRPSKVTAPAGAVNLNAVFGN